MNQRTFKTVVVTSTLIFAAIMSLATPTFVRGQSEYEVFEKKIVAMLKEAERLQSVGAADKAEFLLKQVQQLRARFAEANEKSTRKQSDGNQKEILSGLKAGAASLRALGRIDQAKAIERVVAELQKKAAATEKHNRGDKNEREVVLGQIKVMRIAMQALLDADRKDLAGMIEHTIHAQELALEGVRNEKAAKVRETAPKLGQRIELMMFASRKLREAGKKEEAGAVGNLAEQLMVRLRAQQKRGHEGKQGGSEKGEKGEKAAVKRESTEQKVAAGQIEVMQIALAALREGERRDSVDIVNRAIQARQIRLKMLKGKEAKYVLEREPKLEQTVEALAVAAGLWREFGNQRNTALVRNLVEKLSAGGRGNAKERAQKERPRKEKTGKERAGIEEQVKRISQLEAEIAKLRVALEKRLVDLKEIDARVDR